MPRQITTLIFPISPDDIDSTQHFWNAFDHSETEVSARWIVRYCQKRGSGWEPIPLSDLEAFYAEHHLDGFTFNKLTSRGWVWVNDGLVILSDEFVARCYVSSPTDALTVESIRRSISRLEGELSRLTGQPILIWHGAGADPIDIPPGGALLTVNCAISDQSYCEWYPSLESAKAALLSLARTNHCYPDETGLNVDLSPDGAQFHSGAYITRRDPNHT